MPQLYIAAEREIAGFEPCLETNGRSLSQESEHLDRIAEEIGVRPLMSFFSMDPEESSEEDWFAPEEGLRTVRALSAWLVEHPDAFADAAGLVEELKEFDAVLSRLAQQGVRWHLAIDS